MTTPTGMYGPRFPRLGKIAETTARPLVTWISHRWGLHSWESRKAQDSCEKFREKIAAGKTVYLLGLSLASHNTGAALVECSKATGVRVVGNEEEERFVGEKHCMRFPYQSLDTVHDKLLARNCSGEDIHAVLGTWDYNSLLPTAFRTVWEHAPHSFQLLRKNATIGADPAIFLQAFRTPGLLSQVKLFARQNKVPVIMMPHHDNHAYLGYTASPFVGSKAPTLIAVLDGFGDHSTISIYQAREQQLKLLYANRNITDSLGVLYGIISSTQGGWTPNSSEGRYMGAAAWGDRSRTTNRYYSRLRQILHFGEKGQIFINRNLAGWHLGGQHTPYRPALREILGEPIPIKKMWNPDHVLNVDNIRHAETTADRVERAAALQLVFEDGLFHVLEYWVKQTQAGQLVLNGGTALNCVANMHLLERLDEAFYQKNFGRRGRMQLWVPPTPGDAGIPMGAAINYAMQNGVPAQSPCLSSPYLCGTAPTSESIKTAVDAFLLTRDRGRRPFTRQLGSINDQKAHANLALLMATAVSQGGVIGLFQGPAETGPRALGNRSILANPCNPDTLAVVNSKVKMRERIRPLAPMVTLEAAKELFKLSSGASFNSYSAYDYMILTAPARKIAFTRIPAVIHKDGTSRIQIVRRQTNPFIYAYLVALGQLTGVEVSVNTSLNVGSPMAQTATQALGVLLRAKALDGLVMISAEGQARVAWLASETETKDQTPMNRWLNTIYPAEDVCEVI